eukprot:TRINITY_DN4945_c0_g1_i1.p1 TRINITY_DN4945_c0_g1~~TRINITY_DN4945_c0_g1_i1.p1  ORF type:complete len:477 (+),score=75.49 TRINITY_DN4945_c0_g1_i1:35-1465(+)
MDFFRGGTSSAAISSQEEPHLVLDSDSFPPQTAEASSSVTTATEAPSYRDQIANSAFDSFNYSGFGFDDAGPLAGWIYGAMTPASPSMETHLLDDTSQLATLASQPTLENIGKLQIQDTISGEYVTLQSLWEQQPVVIGFFRRFGCRLCRWGALQLSRIKPLLDAAGVRLVAVGFEAHGLQSFIDGRFFDGDVYVDLTRACYRGLGLQNLGFFRGMAALLTDRRVTRSLKMAKDIPLGDFQGDGMQLGATFVVNKGGNVVLEHRQQHFGDFPVLDDLCNAVISMCKDQDLPKLNLIVNETKRRKGRKRKSRKLRDGSRLASSTGSQRQSTGTSDSDGLPQSQEASTMTSPRSDSPDLGTSPTSQTDLMLSALHDLNIAAQQQQTADAHALSRPRPARNPWTSQTVADAQACKECHNEPQLVEDDPPAVLHKTSSTMSPGATPNNTVSPARSGRLRTSRRRLRPKSRTVDMPLEGLG